MFQLVADSTEDQFWATQAMKDAVKFSYIRSIILLVKMRLNWQLIGSDWPWDWPRFEIADLEKVAYPRIQRMKLF